MATDYANETINTYSSFISLESFTFNFFMVLGIPAGLKGSVPTVLHYV
jgi:hypothetical protein